MFPLPVIVCEFPMVACSWGRLGIVPTAEEFSSASLLVIK